MESAIFGAGGAPGVSCYPDPTASPTGRPVPVMNLRFTCAPFSLARPIFLPAGQPSLAQ